MVGHILNVTVSGKTRHIANFMINFIELATYLIRSTTRSSFRANVRFVVEIQRFVCDCATPQIIEKLRSKGIAMHAYSISAYYA